MKKILLFSIAILLVFIFFNLVFNVFSNIPNLIYSNNAKEINDTIVSSDKGYKDWLWEENREFSYVIIYLNIFSPGSCTFSVSRDILDNGERGFVLSASFDENDFFKKIYDAKMTISSQVRNDSKVPLVYREASTTPEKEKTKEILFYPEDNIAKRENNKFKIPDKTYDPLSAFFNFLASEFIIGKPVVLNLLSKEEIYEFKVVPRELKNEIYILEGEVFRKDRSSRHGAKFTMWVLNGDLRVPLLVKVVSAAGPIYLRLKSIK